MIALQVDYLEGKILTSQAFYKRAKIVGTPEHRKLNKCKEAFPDYDLVVRTPKKSTQNRLTYTFMEEYIMTHETKETVIDTLNEFWELKQQASCYTKGTGFSIVKAWFLRRYPEIVTCGSDTQNESVQLMKKAS